MTQTNAQGDRDTGEYYAAGFRNLEVGSEEINLRKFYEQIRGVSPEDLATYREAFFEPMIERDGFENLPKEAQKEYILIRLASLEGYAERIASGVNPRVSDIQRIIFDHLYELDSTPLGIGVTGDPDFDGSERSAA